MIHFTSNFNIYNYYIRLYFTVFLLARSNTRDIPFSNILITKKQFLCNKKSYCTLVQNQWMKLLSPSDLVTPIQYNKKGSKFSTNFKISQIKNFIKFQNFQKFPKISKFHKFSRILCNKTITTLELDQYEVLWSRV